jgi:hypothetical protein
MSSDTELETKMVGVFSHQVQSFELLLALQNHYHQLSSKQHLLRYSSNSINHLIMEDLRSPNMSFT